MNSDQVVSIRKTYLLELLIYKEMFDRLESGDVFKWKDYDDVIKGNHIGNGILQIDEVEKNIWAYIDNMKSTDIFSEYMIDHCFHDNQSE